MKAFPIFLRLDGRPVLLVGSGPAATAKARLLLAARARLTVIAADPCEDLVTWAQEDRLRLEHRPFKATDCDKAAVVIAASGLPDLDRRVAEAAGARSLPVNVVDNPDLSSFIVPAIIDRGDVVVGISTNGSAPVLARRLRRAIETLLPRRVGSLAAFARRYRKAVEAAVETGPDRRAFWEGFFDGPIARRVLAGDETGAHADMISALNRQTTCQGRPGKVAIVGAGPGDPELLTLRAFRLLQDADTLVYDNLVGPEVLDLARRDAELLFVGKAPGQHSHSQAEINDLLYRLAAEGQRVVRLKGGDPFVFGRGGEEVEHLVERGIEVELVPGITAATGCAAAVGLPLTHRDHASAVTFVSGHGKAGEPDVDWQALARSRQTLVVYMGVAASQRIAQRLIENGLDPATPVAIVERGTLPDQRTIFGTIESLSDLVAAHGVKPPALFVIGDVVRLADRSAILGEPPVACVAAE